MTVRQMSLAELELIIGWAADEGWNPGLEDASAFYAADPDGFFLKEVDGQAVAAVSVVNHSDDFAFLGLYLCRPVEGACKSSHRGADLLFARAA